MKALLPVCLVCVGIAALASCSKREAPPPAPPPDVGVVTVQPQTVPLTKDLVGRLTAYRTADVRARVAGVLLKRVYKEGAKVKEGQLLFQIDPAPLQAALRTAEAQLAQARATYVNAQATARRSRALAPKGFISGNDLDNVLANERTARAAVQAADAGVDTARINLGYASVTSPIAGRAGQQQVTEGALVGQGTDTLLTTVDQIDRLYVNFTLSSSERNQLWRARQAGAVALNPPDTSTVQVSFPNGAPYPEPGVVDFSATTVDPSTGAVDMRALIPNPQLALLPGDYVTLKLTLGKQHGVYLVPQQGVQRDAGGAYVLTVGKDGKVAQQNIDLNGMDGADWIVTSGLSPGAKVIVSGLQATRPGSPVKASPWQPPAASSGPASAPMSAGAAGN